MAFYFEVGKQIDMTQDLSCSVLNCEPTEGNMLGFNLFMLNNRDNYSQHNYIYYKNNICF
jgi:hypothetical protein